MSKASQNSELDKILLSFINNKKESLVPTKIKFSQEEVESGNFKKVAFDVYKVDNDPYENLWRLESLADGPYLIRTDAPDLSLESRGEWQALSDIKKENVTLYYKNIAIARFSSSEYGYSRDDIFAFKKSLLEQVNNDNGFLKNILETQPIAKKEALTKSFPEFESLYKRK
jgi:hypothetical protein